MPYMTAGTVDEILDMCWWHIAHRELEQRDSDFPDDPVDDRHRWVAARAMRWKLEHDRTARELLAARPDLGVEQLAETLRFADT